MLIWWLVIKENWFSAFPLLFRCCAAMDLSLHLPACLFPLILFYISPVYTFCKLFIAPIVILWCWTRFTSDLRAFGHCCHTQNSVCHKMKCIILQPALVVAGIIKKNVHSLYSKCFLALARKMTSNPDRH